MSNLIPQVRVNKRGFAVTKYVRPDNAEKANRLIPSLSTATQEVLNRRIIKTAIKDAMDEGVYEGKELRCSRARDLEPFLADGFSSATIAAYAEGVQVDSNGVYRDLLVSVMNNLDSDKAAAHMFMFIGLEESHDPTWGRFSNAPRFYRASAELYYGLHRYRDVGFSTPENILDVSSPESRQAIAVMTLSSHLYRDYMADAGLPDLIEKDEGGRGDIAFVSDLGLVSLVMERPDDVEQIVAIIREELVADPEAIRAMLDAPVQALRGGAI